MHRQGDSQRLGGVTLDCLSDAMDDPFTESVGPHEHTLAQDAKRFEQCGFFWCEGFHVLSVSERPAAG